MATTTNVVKFSAWRDTYRRHGYFFREVAMLTILMGSGLHLFRVIFGNELTLQYAVTLESGVLLMIPMMSAAIAGILSYRRMVFVNRVHKVALTASLAYITASVPLQHMAGYWFSWLLICLVYPAFLVMLWKVKYRS
jgi:hypothetical protein